MIDLSFSISCIYSFIGAFSLPLSLNNLLGFLLYRLVSILESLGVCVFCIISLPSSSSPSSAFTAAAVSNGRISVDDMI